MGLAEQPDPRLTALVRRVVIVGAGIVGTALAAYLGERSGLDITVLERGPGDRLLGSTGHAPGFLGLLNEVPVATELARTSSDAYERLEHRGLAGFDRVGGLEVATSSAEMTRLEVRAELAGTYRLPAQILTASQAAECAPSLVDRGACIGGVLYPHDGTARANVITAAYKVRAMQGGATFVHDAAVTAISVNGREVRAVGTVDTQFHADDIVIACGVWGPMIAALVEVELPLTPVAHPYVYGPDVGGNLAQGPFVRWPEHHVYARAHGPRLGLGTYDHQPRPVPIDELGHTAEQRWPGALFDDAVARAMALLPPVHRFTPEKRLNGVFAMTPDNLPLLGPVGDIGGLWAAEAVWVTHAAGAAHALAQLMTGTAPDIEGLEALAPGRFAGRTDQELTESSLRLYRDIYSST